MADDRTGIEASLLMLADAFDERSRKLEFELSKTNAEAAGTSGWHSSSIARYRARADTLREVADVIREFAPTPEFETERRRLTDLMNNLTESIRVVLEDGKYYCTHVNHLFRCGNGNCITVKDGMLLTCGALKHESEVESRAKSCS